MVSLKKTDTKYRGVTMDKFKLKILIAQSGKSIFQIQNEAGMTSGSLYKLLNGTSDDIGLKRAFKLADALGVDINEFRDK